MKNSKNFILRIFLETKTTFSLFFTRHNFALVHEIFGRFFNIHRVKSIQKSLNYRTSTDSIVFDRCRRARARVSIFDEFRNFFRGNFEKTEKFRNGKRRKFRYFIFFFGLHRGPNKRDEENLRCNNRSRIVSRGCAARCLVVDKKDTKADHDFSFF